MIACLRKDLRLLVRTLCFHFSIFFFRYSMLFELLFPSFKKLSFVGSHSIYVLLRPLPLGMPEIIYLSTTIIRCMWIPHARYIKFAMRRLKLWHVVNAH